MVVIENPQEIEFVKNMGSFGTIFRHWRAKRTKKGRIFRQNNVITDFLWCCSLIKLVIKITLVYKTHTNLRMKYFILASTRANLWIFWKKLVILAIILGVPWHCCQNYVLPRWEILNKLKFVKVVFHFICQKIFEELFRNLF